ncbi:hypothetical protein [Demequina muriae]|uniref:DUF4367 domain-containing protein n=1 Tax=Demequina muriae TaxID=3051664 RepID=A0ABT8GHC0_9MICO|nr:hypothetical protein [Demequina sp. EGI L300058]MDN4480666.1 hypothetical protein [Demequina sp. EGI L300058]
MATQNSGETRNPWLPVHDDGAGRGAVAPSKPAMPATRLATPRPEPIDVGDADVIAPVALPPQHEILPSSPSAPTAPSVGRASGAAQVQDPFSALGDSAVRSASLSASGAPTPLGGVPMVTPLSRESGAAEGPSRDDTPAAQRPPSPVVSDDAPAYMPRVSAGSADEPEDQTKAAGDGSDGDHPASAATPWWRSVPVLVIAGLLVMGGVGYVLYLALWPQEQVELTPAVIVAPPEVAALDPIALEDPTDFQSAMPGLVGLYAMTELEAPPVATLDLRARAAEVARLTYSDQQTTLTVQAIQHFDEEDAVAQFEALAADGTAREPVTAGGAQVGERATVPADGGQAVVWRNGTVVFEVTGPADAVEGFFAIFPL